MNRAEQLKNRSNFESKGKLFLVHCEQCHKENYAPAVASGTCAWCGWSEEPVVRKDEASNCKQCEEKIPYDWEFCSEGCAEQYFEEESGDEQGK